MTSRETQEQTDSFHATSASFRIKVVHSKPLMVGLGWWSFVSFDHLLLLRIDAPVLAVVSGVRRESIVARAVGTAGRVSTS